MKKNFILSASLVVMQIIRVIISLFAAIHILIVIGSLIKEMPLQEMVNQIETLIFNSGGLKIHELTKSNQWLSYLLILQNMVTLVFLFNILGYGIEIIRNIQRRKTFTEKNIKAFDKISQLSVLLFFIKFIKLSPDRIGIGFEFTYLFLAFGAIILTQVFKEGHRLLQENELTV